MQYSSSGDATDFLVRFLESAREGFASWKAALSVSSWWSGLMGWVGQANWNGAQLLWRMASFVSPVVHLCSTDGHSNCVVRLFFVWNGWVSRIWLSAIKWHIYYIPMNLHIQRITETFDPFPLEHSCLEGKHHNWKHWRCPCHWRCGLLQGSR